MRSTRFIIAAGFATSLFAGAAYADPVSLTMWHMEQPPQRVHHSRRASHPAR